MKPSYPRPIPTSLIGLAALAIASQVSPLMAQTLTATPSTVTLTCSTTGTGPGAAVNVTIKPATALTGANTIAVTVGSLAGTGLVVTAPQVTTLSTANQTAGIVFSVRIANGCSGATTGNTTFRFQAGGVNDVTITAARTVTVGATSPLTTSQSAVTVFCTRTSGGVYTPAAAQKVVVRSATTGGTPFTVDTSGTPHAAWITVSPTSGGTANSTTGVELSIVATAGCGGFAAGTSNNTTVRLLNSPSPVKTIPVTLRVVPPSTLTVTPNPALITQNIGAATPGRVDINVTSATVPAPFFSVDPTSLPSWLTADAMGGVTPKSLRFSTTALVNTMAPGTYQTNIVLQVANYADYNVPITLQLNNPAPKLSVAEGTTRNIAWTIGTPLPTPFITVVSNGSPIPFTVDTSGPLAPIVSSTNLKDLAYSFGTPIPVTFSPTIFASAQPGTVLEGTVGITSGNPASTITVTFRVTVQAAGAVISSLAPASLPSAPPGQVFTMAVTGNNFVMGTDLSMRTKVGIVSAGVIVTTPNIAVNVLSVSTMMLSITVPAATDTSLPFGIAGGGQVTLGVCNPSGSNCTIPSSTATFNIGSAPIIRSVASASSFIQVTPPAIQTIAPYDIVNIYGASFCSSSGVGCSSTDVIRGVQDPATLAYPTWVSPDAVSATQRKLTVTFQTRATPPVVIAQAPILFASNTQIGIVTPGDLAASAGSSVDMVVSFGYGTGNTLLVSSPFQLNVAASNPGLYTVNADGQGDGAILGPTLTAVASGTEAGMRSNAPDSDVVHIFATGLGVPNSTGDNATAGTSGAYSGDCISTSTYLDSLNAFAGTSLTLMDGLVLNSTLYNVNRISPCFLSASALKPTVTIGGVAATVTYAGWVPDSLAGLYQISARLPATSGGPFTDAAGASVAAITRPVQLPVVVTAQSRTSQTGVNIWVTRKLKLTGPSGAGLTGRVGVAWSSSNNAVTATLGTSPYRYSLTSGVLPAGLTLNTSTGAITGTPAASSSGTYLVTVTATDSANFPVSDKISFTLTVTGGLVTSLTGTAPFQETYGTADATVTTVSATGGIYPYTFEITSPSPVPFGLSIDKDTGVVSVSNLIPAGTYQVTVTATDSTADTPLTGTISFDIVVGLRMARTGPAAGANGTASTISTVSATGNTGTVTYALDSTSAALAWLSLDANTGVLSISNAAPVSTRTVTVTATDGTAPTGAATAGTGTITVQVVVN